MTNTNWTNDDLSNVVSQINQPEPISDSQFSQQLIDASSVIAERLAARADERWSDEDI